MWHMVSTAWGRCGTGEFPSCCVMFILPRSDGDFPDNDDGAEGTKDIFSVANIETADIS